MYRTRKGASVVALCLMACLVRGVWARSASNLDVFDVRAYGAKGNADSVDTKAIQDTIDVCHAAGGGRVLLPAGAYKSGTLRLRDHVTIHLQRGARLIGTVDLASYSGFESGRLRNSRWNRGLIVGENLDDIAITGSGLIDGNKVFDPQGEERMRGPHTILLKECRGMILRDVTIRDSANYAFLFYACTKVRVENTTFEGGWDGVHFRGLDFREGPAKWNQDVLIRGCQFFTGDDCIAGHYIEDAVIEDCVINSSCNGVRVIGPAKRLTFRQCKFFGPGRFEHRTSQQLHRTNMLAGLLIQPSAWTPTPGPLEDLHISDTSMQNVACALHVCIRQGNTAERITVERLKATDVYSQALSVESWADEAIEQVTLQDIDITYAADAFEDPRMEGKPQVQVPIRQPGVGVWGRKLPVWGLYGRKISQLRLDRIRLRTNDLEDARPVVRVDNVERLRLEHLQHSPLRVEVQIVECNGVGAVVRDDSPEAPLPPRLGKSR